ncbi:reverse transcriptase domain-containing protein [Trichonephila clavipes]|nr:reverse transcriptase domain-containing protein [Trichonephila clavipes]
MKHEGRHFTFLLGAAKLLAPALPGDIGKKIWKIIWKPFDTVKRQRKQKLLYSFSSHLSGEELKKQLRAFDLKPNDDCEGVILQQVLQEFDKYFLDYQNKIFASFKFLEIKQEQGEKFTDYYSRLRNAVVECNYGESQDRMLRDKLIQGLLDKALQERLIRETSKKSRALQEVVSECKTAENTAPRKVPLAIHKKVKEELSNMVEVGIISKVEEPTEWVSNMVVIDSPKKLRICLDPRPLNEAIQRSHYQIPTADALITKLQGGKVFTILDAKNGFWQLPLDEESSYLTTF